jgi:hypothetical protein
MGGTVPPLPQYAFMAWCSVGGGGAQERTSLFRSAACKSFLCVPLYIVEGETDNYLGSMLEGAAVTYFKVMS